MTFPVPQLPSDPVPQHSSSVNLRKILNLPIAQLLYPSLLIHRDCECRKFGTFSHNF